MKISSKKVLATATALCVATSMLLAGCSSDSDADAGSSASESTEADEPQYDLMLQIYAAEPLSDAMREAQQRYSEVAGIGFDETQFMRSGEINERLGAGDYADIEITATAFTMNTALERGYVNPVTKIDMFRNELVIVAKEDSSLEDVTLADIASGEYTLCVGDVSLSVGNYAAQALSTVGVFVPLGSDAGMTGPNISGTTGYYDIITPMMESSSESICSTVADGKAQLAIVTSADACKYEGIRAVGVIPADAYQPIIFPGAVTAASEHLYDAADFLVWCISDQDAIEIFTDWGFYPVA